MGSYLLELNNSSSKGEFDSDSDSLVESNPFFHENKANRPKKSGKNKGKKACKHHKFDALLSQMTHICTPPPFAHPKNNPFWPADTLTRRSFFDQNTLNLYPNSL